MTTKTKNKKVYETPQLQEFELTSEGVLCQSGLETEHEDLTYERFEW